jgi:chromosome segregation ATPase
MKPKKNLANQSVHPVPKISGGQVGASEKNQELFSQQQVSGLLQDYLNLLDALACTLADERLRLLHQIENLAAAQADWDKKYVDRLQELDARFKQLHEAERLLNNRTIFLRNQQTETQQTRLSLESWQTRLTIQTANWKGERERLLARTHSLEEQAGRLSEIIGSLPANWKDQLSQANLEIVQKHNNARTEMEYARLRQELQMLRDQRAAFEEQIAELNAEVERLAALLLEENNPFPLPMAKAA